MGVVVQGRGRTRAWNSPGRRFLPPGIVVEGIELDVGKAECGGEPAGDGCIFPDARAAHDGNSRSEAELAARDHDRGAADLDLDPVRSRPAA